MSYVTIAPHPPTPFSHRRRGKVPLPWERDIPQADMKGRGHFQLHNSFRLAVLPKIAFLDGGLAGGGVIFQEVFTGNGFLLS